MKFISVKIAATFAAAILGLTSIYHVMALLGFIPMDMVWGGRLESVQEMQRMEGVSLGVNLLLIGLVATRAGWFKVRIPQGLVRGFCWFFAVVFLLNTVGNLLAFNSLETYIFTPLTLILALMFTRMGTKD